MHRALLPAALLATCLVAPGAAAQRAAQPLGAARVAAQVGAGIVATPLGFVAAGVATKRLAQALGASERRASRLATASAWTGAALATAAAPWAIGGRGRAGGSYAAALGGALAGGAGSYALVRLNRRGDDDQRPCRLACSLAAAAVFALPSVGATVGYNLSRRAGGR